MNDSAVTVRPVHSKKDRKAFVDFAWAVYKADPHWVPPLKDEVHGLITPGKNPWFEHARAALAGRAQRQGGRADQRPGRRAGPAAYGQGHRQLGDVRGAGRRSR